MLAEELTQTLGTKLLACFIHEVIPVHETATRLRRKKQHVSAEEAHAWPQIWKQKKIYLAKDYISMAAEVNNYPGLEFLDSLLNLFAHTSDSRALHLT